MPVVDRSETAMTNKQRYLSILLPLFVVLCGTVNAQRIVDIPDAKGPDATNILRSVRRNFPERPVHVNAELTAKNKRGDIMLNRNVEFTLDFSSSTATAVYAISDAFGEELERLVITRPEGEAIRYEHSTGSDTNTTPLADPSAPIDGLDFSWSDLAMDFLWWPNVSLVGHENKLNRPCYILDVRPDASSTGTYAYVQLWVDQNTSALLEAQGCDRESNLLKKLQIKNLKKVDTLWTVGDVEVHSYPSHSKTRLRIRTIKIDQ